MMTPSTRPSAFHLLVLVAVLAGCGDATLDSTAPVEPAVPPNSVVASRGTDPLLVASSPEMAGLGVLPTETAGEPRPEAPTQEPTGQAETPESEAESDEGEDDSLGEDLPEGQSDPAESEDPGASEPAGTETGSAQPAPEVEAGESGTGGSDGADDEGVDLLIPATPAGSDPFVDLSPVPVFTQSVAAVTGSAYHVAWEQWRDFGYTPVRLAGVTTPSGGVRYSGIWRKDVELLGWSSLRGRVATQLAADVSSFSGSGYRLLDLDAHVVDGVVDYDEVWVLDAEPIVWEAEWSLTESQLLGVLEDYSQRGVRPTTINAYRIGGETRYIVVAVADPRAWWAVVDGTSDQYAQAWSTLRDQGMAPIDISVVDTGELSYNGVWARDTDITAWYSTRDMSAAGFDALRIERKAANYALVDLDAYYDGDTLRFSAVWHRGRPRRNGLTSNLGLSGSSISALQSLLSSYEGTVGFFVEDLTNGNFLAFNHHEHMYMASTTKVLIAARVLDMVDRGELSVDTLIPYTSTDYRQASDNSRMTVGGQYTVEQYLRWMINASSTGATDLLHSLVGHDLDEFIAAHLGLVNVGEITSICELDARILESFDSCYHDVPCHIFEPWWRDRSTSDPDYGAYQDCLGRPSSLHRPSGTATYDALYSSYYATLANSITPAAYGRFWRALVGGDILSPESTALLVDILDGTGNGTVDDDIINRGFFNGLGGKHGGKRKARSWVGLAWFRNGSDDPADATFQYSVSIFTENWASSSDDAQAKAVITESLGHILTFLDAAR